MDANVTTPIPCVHCGKRREHAHHDPRARVYREDQHEYERPCSVRFEDGARCGQGASHFLHDLWKGGHRYQPLEAVTA